MAEHLNPRARLGPACGRQARARHP